MRQARGLANSFASFFGGTAQPSATIEAYVTNYGVRISHGWGMTQTTPRCDHLVRARCRRIRGGGDARAPLDHLPKWWLPDDAIAFAKELPHRPDQQRACQPIIESGRPHSPLRVDRVFCADEQFGSHQ